MRTTIELTDEQRGRLLELAARRGVKGFSSLVQEAIERYLDEQASRGDALRDACAVLRTFDDAGADALSESMRRTRSSWR